MVCFVSRVLLFFSGWAAAGSERAWFVVAEGFGGGAECCPDLTIRERKLDSFGG